MDGYGPRSALRPSLFPARHWPLPPINSASLQNRRGPPAVPFGFNLARSYLMATDTTSSIEEQLRALVRLQAIDSRIG